MSEQPDTRAAGPRHDRLRARLRGEQIDVLYRLSAGNVYITAAVIPVLAALPWGKVAWPPVAAWAGLFYLVLAGRLVLERAYRGATETERTERRWLPLLLLAIGATGCMWGAVPFVLFPAGDLVMHLVLACGVLAMLASMTPMLSCYPPAAAIAGITMGLPLVVRLSLDPVYGSFYAGMVLLLVAVVLFTCWRFHRFLADSLRLRSEVAAVNEELIAAKERAEETSRLKSQFIANMSHELRTPLNAINGFAEMIWHESFGPHSTPRYGEYAKDIYDSGQHLLALIGEILDLAKIEAGKLTLNEAEVDLVDAVERSLKLVKDRAEKKKVVLHDELEPGLPPLRGDERAIRQILLNLLTNAVKFTAEDGEVRLRAYRANGGAVALNVTDTGIGIAEDMIPAVMQPFTQVESDKTRNFEGTGLGLAITKALTEMHGGTIEVKSELGKGTSITVLLPRERALDVPAEAAE